MIPEVVPGQRLTAKTQNEIIQACNGLMQPAGEYVNTPNGSLFPNPTPKFNNMLPRCVETLFQLKFELKQHLSQRIADEDLQTLSGTYALSAIWYGYSMNLGNDFSQLKDQVKLMQPDNDDIFIIGGKGINGNSDQENGSRLSVHLTGSQMLIDGSDKEGFFDLGVYWKSPNEGCTAIEVQKLQLSSDSPQYGPTKNAFVIRGRNYPSQSIIEDWYENKYGDTWRVIDNSVTTVGYVYDQKLVQCRTGLLFPETAMEWVDSQISAVELSSIQERSISDLNYHEMFNFDQAPLSDFALSDQSDCDIVIRDYKRDRVPRGACVSYVKVHDFLSATRYDVDTDATGGDQRSLEVIPHNQDHKRDYLQLYNFDVPYYDNTIYVDLNFGETRWASVNGGPETDPDPNLHFIVRDRTNNVEVQYDNLAIYLPHVYADDVIDLSTVISDYVHCECSCDLEPLWAALSALSSELSNYWKVGGTYSDNCYGESIGDSSANLAIDLDRGELWYGSSLTEDWHACELYDHNGGDGPGYICINWADRLAYNSGGIATIDWSNGILRESSGIPTVDWLNKQLLGDYGTAVDWHNHMLVPTGGSPTVEWANCILDDLQAGQSLDWNNKELIGDWKCPYGSFTIGSGFGLTIGNTTLTESQLSALLALI